MDSERKNLRLVTDEEVAEQKRKERRSDRRFRMAMAATIFVSSTAMLAWKIKSSYDFDSMPPQQQLSAIETEAAQPCIPPWLVDPDYCAVEARDYQRQIAERRKQIQENQATPSVLATPQK